MTTYTYSPANRLQLARAGSNLTSYTHDGAGNRTQTQDNGGFTYYSWNTAGQMASAEPIAGVVSFTYNADGQRVAKYSNDGSVTGFLYDHKKLLHETDEVGGNITSTYALTGDEEYGDLVSEDDNQQYYQFDAHRRLRL